MQYASRLARSITRSAFLRQNATFLFGSLLVGFVNYLYYPALGRLVHPDVYGEVQAVVALFMQLTIFLTVLTQVTVHVIANYQDENQKRKVVFELERFAFIIALGMLAVGTACSWWLMRFFQFSSVWPLILLLVVFVASVPLAFRTAYLRAHRKFGLVSIANLVSALGRILFSVLFVCVGLQTMGAIGGLLAAQLLAFGYAAYEAHRLGFARPEDGRYLSVPALDVLAPELKYALFVLVGTAAITLLTSIDVFVAKHFFSPQIAGEYAGVSTIARTIFFITSPIALVLLANVRMHGTIRENRRLLMKSVALTLAIGVPIVLVCVLAAPVVTTVLMGRQYLPYAHLLPVLSMTMLLLSVVNVVISYYIALRKYQIWFIVLTCIGGPVLLMWSRHGDVQDIAMNLLCSSIGMLVLVAAWRGWVQLQTIKK